MKVYELMSEHLRKTQINAATWSIYYNVKEHGAIGDGNTDDAPAISSLFNKIEGEATVIFPDGHYRIGSDLVVPENVVLYFVGGGILEPDEFVNIKINGGILAGPYRILGGKGNADGSKPIAREVLPQWWGAKGDGATDDTLAIKNTRDMASEGSTIMFLAGAYKVSDPALLTSPVGVRYLAEGYSSTFLYNGQVHAIPTFTLIASLGPDKVVGTDPSGSLQTYNMSANQLVQLPIDVNDVNVSLQSHKESIQAHNADAIEYRGNVSGANNTKQAIDNVQTQVNAAIFSGDSSVAAAQAAVDSEGHNYGNLKVRLDTEQTNVLSQLAETAKTAAGKRGILYAGVIRNDGTGWKYISDAVHDNINFSSISVAGNAIQIDYADSKTVGSLVVTPDDTLAGYGLTCGSSVGDRLAYIFCYAPFTGYISGTGDITMNSWFTDAYTVTALGDKTGFTVNYDGGTTLFSEKVLANTIRDSTAPHAGHEIRTARVSGSSCILRAYNELYGYVYYDGSSWQVSSSCIANISASFSGGLLLINHDAMSNTSGDFNFQRVRLDMRDTTSGSLIHARVSSTNQGQIAVQFRDNTGAAISSPNTDMRVYFSRPGFCVPHIWNAAARAYFDFGQALVRPNNLVSANGNLWILGLHQSN